MDIPSSSTRSEDQNISYNLSTLGWTSFFNSQLADMDNQQLPARVVGVRKNIYLVRQESSEITVTLAGKLYHENSAFAPVVGDWVVLRDAVITAILTRKNMLQRLASGSKARKNVERPSAEQAIAANLDVVLIVCGLDRDFNLRRIERYLTLIYTCGLTPVIVLTKADLCSSPEHHAAEVEAVGCGVPVYLVSLLDETSLQPIRLLLYPNKTAALVGSSGAGKSTLINRLVGQEVRTTGMVGLRVGKGRHTTTTRDMVLLPSGGMIIDNPGMREVGLVGSGAEAQATFPDIEYLAYSCRFNDCSHGHEPGCRVRQAVLGGELSEERVESYLKLKSELAYSHERASKSAARVERDRWRSVSQQAKRIKKRRERCE